MPVQLNTLTGVHPDSRTFSSNPAIADSSTLVGIEVEMENANGVRKQLKNLLLWREVSEGSLRNDGMEIVTPPVLGGDILVAMQELEQAVSSAEPSPEVTERTGLHVHLDFRKESVQGLFRFMVVYLIFEGTLFASCEEGREENPYCTPITECDDVLLLLQALISRSSSKVLGVIRGWPKYTACNLKPLTTLGSVEIRTHQGTTDAGVILPWVNLLLSIKKYACESTASPQALIDAVCTDPEKYYQNVFGKFAVLPFSNDVVETMLNGARAAQYMYRGRPIALTTEDRSLAEALYPSHPNTPE